MVRFRSFATVLGRLRASCVFCAIFAAAVVSASAQSVAQTQLGVVSVLAPDSARIAPPTMAGILAAVRAALTPPLATALGKDEFSGKPREASDFMQAFQDVVEFSGTPFTQQVRMPLGSLFGGRIRLGGFNAVIPMVHIQRGLPGGGSLDAWAPVPMGQAGMILPKDDNQYGLCLTFHLAASYGDGRVAKWAGLAARLAAISFW